MKKYGAPHPETSRREFVRAVGIQIFISNTVWSEEDTNGNVGKPFEQFIFFLISQGGHQSLWLFPRDRRPQPCEFPTNWGPGV